MLKQTEKYICTTVSVSEKEKKELPSMDLESNSFLITKIFNEIDNDFPLKPKEKMTSVQIKVDRAFESEYHFIQKRCSELGMSFSKIYLFYIKKFFKV